MTQDAGERVHNAVKEINKADTKISQDAFKEAFEHLRKAYKEAGKK